jgi:hypothetical protein
VWSAAWSASRAAASASAWDAASAAVWGEPSAAAWSASLQQSADTVRHVIPWSMVKAALRERRMV